MDKARITEILREISILLDLKGENVFKVRAYENAARTLEGTTQDLAELIEAGGLQKLKGIGEHIAEIICNLFHHGRSEEHEALRHEFPVSLFELFRIAGLGAKRIKILYEQLGVQSVKHLESACQTNKLVDLPGFGEKSQEKIMQGISHFKTVQGYFLIDFARRESDKVTDYLRKQKGILKMEVAGSVRRHKEVVKDIDVLVSAKDPGRIHRAFVQYPGVETVVASGETKSSVVLKTGIPCDLRTVTVEEFPYALYYFTGSKEHNVAVRTMAKKRSIKINEYGLFRGKEKIICRNEKAIFQALGLHDIPPDLRENTGEIEYAKKKTVPTLVAPGDLRGVLHVHSSYSDGEASLEEIIAAAQERGYGYIGIADHSQASWYANGMKPDRVKKQWQEIDQLQKQFEIRIFKGVEVDILPDGRLDYPDALLSEFDFTVAAVHSRFHMSEKEMTTRICRAMANPYVTFLAHPTGRLLLDREPYAIDLTKIIEGAGKLGVAVELNANPHRLDLDWRMCRLAKAKGVPVAINPDAHCVEGLDDVIYGVGIARKGWLEGKDVVNTLSAKEVEIFFKRRRRSRR